MNTPNFEDEYLDVLQNIEFAIMRVYQEHPELADSNVETAIQALIRTYRSQSQSKEGKPPPSPLSAKVYDYVKHACDWRLGQEDLTNPQGETISLDLNPVTVEEIVLCLQRIRRSIRLWTKQGGRQGYLNFISQFVG
jgi:hypothetical protein